MQQHLLGFLILLVSLQVNAQSDSVHLQKLDSSRDKQILAWVGALYEHGIRIDKDSMVLSVEVQHIITDDSLRSLLFPEVYTWEQTLLLMQQMELKRAFWFLINLYPQQKELVMRTVLGYDELFEMDHALVAAFYTYSMLDPAVCDFVDGKPIIKRPDIVEAKLASVKEMVGYVLSYRAQQQKN
jgi:hypothetical protein